MIHLNYNIAFFRKSSPYFFYLVSISISREIVSTNSIKKYLLSCLQHISLVHSPMSMLILSSYYFIALGKSRFSKISPDTLRIRSYPADFEITKVTNSTEQCTEPVSVSVPTHVSVYTFMGCKQAYIFNFLSLPVLF